MFWASRFLRNIQLLRGNNLPPAYFLFFYSACIYAPVTLDFISWTYRVLLCYKIFALLFLLSEPIFSSLSPFLANSYPLLKSQFKCHVQGIHTNSQARLILHPITLYTQHTLNSVSYLSSALVCKLYLGRDSVLAYLLPLLDNNRILLTFWSIV